MKLPQPAGADWSGGTSPLPRLRDALAEARRDGLDFAEAWARALRLVPGRSDRQLIAETAESWRNAYEGQPPSHPERALEGLLFLVEDEPAIVV